MSQVTVKIPRNTYLAIKAVAKKRGCFIGRVIADSFTFYIATIGKPEPPKEQASSGCAASITQFSMREKRQHEPPQRRT